MNRLFVVAAVIFGAGCSHTKSEPGEMEDKSASGLVEISPEAQAHFGLQVEAAQIRELDEYLQVPGTAQPIDSRVNTVRPLARGRLHDVLVRVGDRAQKGQTFATYDNIEAGELAAQLASANTELDRLRAQERNLARQTDRARALTEIGALPKKDFEQASADQEAAQQSIKSQEGMIAGIQTRLRRFDAAQTDVQATPLTIITSPFAGVVIRQEASPGETVEPSSALFTIANLATSDCCIRGNIMILPLISAANS